VHGLYHQYSRLSGISRSPDFIAVQTQQKILAKGRFLREGFGMPSRSQILDAVQNADFNPLACRVARAVADYELAFEGEAHRCGSFDYVQLPAPTNEIEAVALAIALSQEPSCAESGYITAETANSFYGTLSSNPSTTFTQSFNVSTEKPMISKKRKPRPGLIIPETGGKTANLG
jgi:hypothetical protein